MAQATDQGERFYLDRLDLQTVYLAVLLTDPGDTGAAPSEPATADGYARIAIPFSVAATVAGVTKKINSGAHSFGPLANVTHNAVYGWGVCLSSVRGTADILHRGPWNAVTNWLINTYLDVPIGNVGTGDGIILEAL